MRSESLMRLTDWQLIVAPFQAILAELLLGFVLLFLYKLNSFLLNEVDVRLILLQVSWQYYQFPVFGVVLLKILDLKAEVEPASLVPLARDIDVTVEGLHDSLADA